MHYLHNFGNYNLNSQAYTACTGPKCSPVTNQGYQNSGFYIPQQGECFGPNCPPVFLPQQTTCVGPNCPPMVDYGYQQNSGFYIPQQGECFGPNCPPVFFPQQTACVGPNCPPAMDYGYMDPFFSPQMTYAHYL